MSFGSSSALRAVAALGMIALTIGASLIAYRYATKPQTLTLSVGSSDGEVANLAGRIAAQLAVTNSGIRLNVVDRGTAAHAAKAFDAADIDLAIVRGDADGLARAKAVVVMAYAAVLIVAPSDSSIRALSNLRGKKVGVLGRDLNTKLMGLLMKANGLEQNSPEIVELGVSQIKGALQAKQVAAVIAALPLTDRYLSALRNALPGNQKFNLLPIEEAEAIAESEPVYESYELQKGALRSAPSFPSEDITTIRVPFYLVAKSDLSDAVVGKLAHALMEAKRSLVGDLPILAQMTAPEVDKDAFIPIHPGAEAYFEGSEKTIVESFGDYFYYGSLLFGALTSFAAAIWAFVKGEAEQRSPATRLIQLATDLREQGSELDHAAIEREVDDILSAASIAGSKETELAKLQLLSLAVHRIERSIDASRRRLVADT